MPYYKDTNDNVHFIESVNFEHLLPDGCVEITETEYQLTPVSQTNLRAEYENAVQNLIDTTAQSKGYDNGIHCASYFNDPYEPFSKEAKIFVTWRSSVWLQYIKDLKEDGNKPLQLTPQEYIATLPIIKWN